MRCVYCKGIYKLNDYQNYRERIKGKTIQYCSLYCLLHSKERDEILYTLNHKLKMYPDDKIQNDDKQSST